MAHVDMQNWRIFLFVCIVAEPSEYASRRGGRVLFRIRMQVSGALCITGRNGKSLPPACGPPVCLYWQRGPAAAGGSCWGALGTEEVPLSHCVSASSLSVPPFSQLCVEKCWLCV